MNIEQSIPPRKLSGCSGEMDTVSSKAKAFTIFNDSTNVSQNSVKRGSAVFKKMGEVIESEINFEGFRGERQMADSVGKVPKSVTVQTASVGLSSLPDQRKALSHKKGGTFTLMVVGPSGSGKTTFINTLFGDNLLDNAVEGEPTKKLTFHRHELIENGFPLKLTVIDTPGFGQHIDNQHSWIPVTKFIDKQFRLHLFQEGQPYRSKMFDYRVHSCLYFIIPNGKGLSQLDICTMKELSKRVNLIPIIAKSDTFNTDALKRFKDIVRQTLNVQNIRVCDLILDQNVKEEINSVMPFAIIGSNELHENPHGQMIRGRKYKWGIAEVENERHCDFLRLRDILMSNNLLDLILSTESHYENYRTLFLEERFKEAIKDKHLSEERIKRIKENGIEQYIYIHNILLSAYEGSAKEPDPILLEKQMQMKEKLTIIISNQEKRFKDWKKALVEKQNVFNNDIEKFHQKIVRLQNVISHLEAGYVVNNDSEYSSLEDDTETDENE